MKLAGPVGPEGNAEMFAKRGLLGLAMVMLLGSTAWGGIVTMTCVFPTDGSLDGSYAWDDQTYILNLSETMGAAGIGAVGVSALTDEDPDFTINKSVNNSSSFIWDKYVITLTNPGSATFVSDSASSTVFQNVQMNGQTELVFTGGEVAIGQAVAFTFVVNLPDAGTFNFGLNQQAVPEPCTMALLAGGILALVRRRRIR